MICILTEKPSAARNFAKAFGGMEGYYESDQYCIVHSIGHIFSFPTEPSELVPDEKEAYYKIWDLSKLPWDEKDFVWRRIPDPGKRSTLNDIRKGCAKADEIVIATDNDPSGEGMLIACEILHAINIKNKVFSRMYFEDETPKSILKAFKMRKRIPVPEKDPEYIKADYRSRWDYLSMQFTRVATLLSPGRALLRNGRLKSFMNVLVGDGLEAYNSYKPSSTYEDAFVDEQGVWYTKKDAVKRAAPEEVDLSALHKSPVVMDGKVKKNVAPPKLLDLSALSALLSKKGMKASYVLNLYQKMYEDSVVSYPRTEDSGITPEQFRELLGNINEIAHVVGVDMSLLTHTAPRSTHVKTGFTHGANRPGTNVPSDLLSLDKQYGKGAALIYETLALNTLAMFCEDQVLEVTSGHVGDFPEYKGSVTNCIKVGFKAIWDTDPEEFPEKRLGKEAAPAVKENKSKRPPYPTMKWLMKQLEKYNVGTGATRTSVYADITSGGKYPLMEDSNGRISLTQYGEINYRLLQGTHIGGAELTEQLQMEMKGIAGGEFTDIDALLHNMQTYIKEDMLTMENNSMQNNYSNKDNGSSEQPTPYQCPLCGRPVIKSSWGYACAGRKDKLCTFSIGNKILQANIPETEQIKLITQGRTGVIHGFVSKKGNKFNASLVLNKNTKEVNFEFADSEPEVLEGVRCMICGSPVVKTPFGYGCSAYRTTGCRMSVSNKILGKKLTQTQIINLLKGSAVPIKGMTGKSGNKFDAKVKLTVENGACKMSFSFD